MLKPNTQPVKLDANHNYMKKWSIITVLLYLQYLMKASSNKHVQLRYGKLIQFCCNKVICWHFIYGGVEENLDCIAKVLNAINIMHVVHADVFSFLLFFRLIRYFFFVWNNLHNKYVKWFQIYYERYLMNGKKKNVLQS